MDLGPLEEVSVFVVLMVDVSFSEGATRRAKEVYLASQAVRVGDGEQSGLLARAAAAACR